MLEGVSEYHKASAEPLSGRVARSGLEHKPVERARPSGISAKALRASKLELTWVACSMSDGAKTGRQAARATVQSERFMVVRPSQVADIM